MGIAHTVVPADADSILPWITRATRLVILESPGSYTMEIQDMEKIALEAHSHRALVSIDNAWGLGLTRLSSRHSASSKSTARKWQVSSSSKGETPIVCSPAK
ncbi:hypothetical protein PSUB009319_40430 [Ralstonia sp. SET104]|nr:hypothetical protein PSUB009319_40430 [Ralstonia sp. SET104]